MGLGRRATAHAEQSSGRGRCRIGALRCRQRRFKSALTFAPLPRSLPSLSRHPRMHGPRLARIATRSFPRLKFRLPPTLNRAVRPSNIAKLHSRLLERPHRPMRRFAHPPIRARSEQRLAHHPLRSAAPTIDRLHFEADELPQMHDQRVRNSRLHPTPPAQPPRQRRGRDRISRSRKVQLSSSHPSSKAANRTCSRHSCFDTASHQLALRSPATNKPVASFAELATNSQTSSNVDAARTRCTADANPSVFIT
jgi:hypothetical protein